MKKFRYEAKDNSGKKSSGKVEAQDKSGAARLLKSRNLFILKLIEETPGLFATLSAKINRRVSTKELANFTRQLSTMITAGLPLTEALQILRSQASPTLSSVVNHLLLDVEGGGALGDAMEKHPTVFPKVYVALVRAGESAGFLDRVMSRLAENTEKSRKFESKIKSALIYPAIIVIGMIGVAGVMMVFVIPKLTSFYSEFGTQLPTPTRILIGISNFSARFWWLILAAGFGAYVTYSRFLAKVPAWQIYFDKFLFELPILGTLRKQVMLTEFTRTLGMLIGAGIPIIEALNIVAEGVGSPNLERDVKASAKLVEKGFPLAYALSSQSDLFTETVPRMLAVGEQTGKVDDVLMRLSKYFESESEQAIKGLTAAIEPLIMILLGIGVAFLVIAIILPIYNLTSQF